MFRALRDVNIDVPKGEFVGVLGHNGSGKSTLLRTAGGIYQPDRGLVMIEGSLSGLYELGITGNRELSGRDFARRLLRMNGVKGSRLDELVEDIEDFSELGERFNDPILTYSAGMGARLFFATATAGHYDVYLIDEVLSVGDAHFQAKCWRRIRERIANGASGILVTHDWAAVLKICRTAHLLDHGRISFSGPSEATVRRYLYGDGAQEPFTEGFARIIERPTKVITAPCGEDLSVHMSVRIERPANVSALAVIERLQPGYGWETMLMSPEPVLIGQEPGDYDVAITFPGLPLEPGDYQINVHLVMPDAQDASRRAVLDGFGWLSGNGLPLKAIAGRGPDGYALPVCWKLQMLGEGGEA